MRKHAPAPTPAPTVLIAPSGRTFVAYPAPTPTPPNTYLDFPDVDEGIDNMFGGRNYFDTDEEPWPPERMAAYVRDVLVPAVRTAVYPAVDESNEDHDPSCR